MASEKLFSEEYLDQLNPEKQEELGPVTVLGLTFKNDEERRQFFREELRRRLPELRQIEGFPIGEDEDIINLSDPPYYTACPNPWLNDFIAEWEKEKKELERDGKRQKNFEVKEPYASDVSEGKNNPVYAAHSYHTKVPHPAIMRYILQYTQPGDIVFDGFAGTGMTGVAAASCINDNDEIAARINAEWQKLYGRKPNWGARHAIIGDLSPYATNIANFYNNPVEIKLFKKEAERIAKELEAECGWMYSTYESVEKKRGEETFTEMVKGSINFVVWSDIFICPVCGQEYVFWNEAVDHKEECLHEEFHCPHCHAIQSKKSKNSPKVAVETYYDEALQKPMKRVKQVPVLIVGKAGKKKIKRTPTNDDLELLHRIEEVKLESSYPTDKLPDGLKTRDPKVKYIYHTHQFYTKRNLITLSHLFSKIEASSMPTSMKFLFSAVAVWCTKMSRVKINYYFHGGGGWNIGPLNNTLYVPGFPIETSVIENFTNKVDSAIRALQLLPYNYHNLLFTNSADCLNIANNSIDYIFTDPPFGYNINYSELNSLPEPWFHVVTNNEHEAIENTAQGKNAHFYRDTMTNCFREFWRILKPGKWMTVEFSNTSAAVWNSIQLSLQSAGFIISTVAALDKKQGSFNAVTTTTAVKQDLVISCYKPSQKIISSFQNNDSQHLWFFVNELIENLAPPKLVEGKIRRVPERDRRLLYDKVVSYYVSHGLQVPVDAKQFHQGLNERYAEVDGMYFTPIQAAKYREMTMRAEGMEAMGLFISDEANGIAWLKHRLEERPQTYQELQPEWMQDIKGVRKGDILPELRTLLEENFIQNEDGTWRIINENDDIDVEKKKAKIYYKEFKVYLEVCQKPRGKLKDVRLEAIRAGFKQCYDEKRFADIILVGDRMPQNILYEDPYLLQYYETASSKM